MSSPSQISAPRTVLVFALASILGGCFAPMYGGPSGSDLVQELHSIKVEPIPDRLGHYLANELVFALNGTGSRPTPKYRLQVQVRQRVQSPVIDSVSGRATAGTVLVDADYKLMPIGGGDPVTSGVAFAAASYDRSSQRFANLRAARDGEIRGAKALAEQIRTRIAIALAKKP